MNVGVVWRDLARARVYGRMTMSSGERASEGQIS